MEERERGRKMKKEEEDEFAVEKGEGGQRRWKYIARRQEEER